MLPMTESIPSPTTPDTSEDVTATVSMQSGDTRTLGYPQRETPPESFADGRRR